MASVDNTTPAPLDLLVLTFNCAKNLIAINVMAAHLRHVLEGEKGGLPDVVVFSLQEMAPMSYGFIGDYFLARYVARFDEALNLAAARVRHMPATTTTSPLASAPLPGLGSSTSSPTTSTLRTYPLIHTANVGYTGLLLWARDPTSVRELRVAEVGFGAAEMGNKGAVGVRFLYVPAGHGAEEDAGGGGADNSDGRETELTFVATHLAAMEWNLPIRNANWAAIMRGLTFENPADLLRPSRERGSSLSAPGPTLSTTSNAPAPAPASSSSSSSSLKRDGNGLNPESAPLLPSKFQLDPHEHHDRALQARMHALSVFRPTSHLFVAGDLNYRISTKSPPPSAAFPVWDEGSENHWSHFLARDQLARERREGRALHGLEEADVRFGPTYKFDMSPSPHGKGSSNSDDTGDGDCDGEDVPDEPRWRFAPHRWPGWTDRILFLEVPPWVRRRFAAAAQPLLSSDSSSPTQSSLSPKIDVVAYDALPLMRTSDHRAVYFRARVPLLSPREMAPPPPGSNLADPAADYGDPRARLPAAVDPEAWARRRAAHRLEVLVGWSMWAGSTRVGAGLLVVAVALGLWAWWLSRAVGNLG